MNNPLQLFYSLLKQVETLPFAEQEAFWDQTSFLLGDFAKRFPPQSIKGFCDYFGTLDKEIGFDIGDKTVLEIGPGFSLGLAFLVALSGARKVFTVDAFPHPMGADHDFIASLFGHLLEDRSFFFSSVKDLSDDNFVNYFATHVAKDPSGRFCFRKDKIEFLFPYRVENLPFEKDTFDLIYTCATFEHFLDPVGAVRELHRVTKPGGISFHSVDLRDHRDFHKPLEFLTLTEEQWNQVHASQSSASYSHTNRLRSPELVALFEKQGFKAVKVLPFLRCSVKEDIAQRAADRFKRFSKDELSILGCTYIFQK